jgi:hypothetical protein
MPESLNNEAPAASTTIDLNLHQRINEVRKEVTYIQKVKKQTMQYSIVSHDDVTAKLRPSLIKWGIAYYPSMLEVSQNGNRTECKFEVAFVNIDDPEDEIFVPTLGYGIDSSDKGPGKAISYGVKMALLKTFNLESGDEEDPDFHQDTKFAKPNPAHAKLDALMASDASQEEILSTFESAIGVCLTVEEINALWHHTKLYINNLEGELKASIMLVFTGRKTALSQQSNSGII